MRDSVEHALKKDSSRTWLSAEQMEATMENHDIPLARIPNGKISTV